MANFDATDLVSRFQLHSGRPSSDASLTTAQIYQYLGDAQHELFNLFAVHCPHYLFGAPTAMSTSDSGATYTFSGSIQPLAVEIYDGTNGPLLRPAAYWDAAGDYVWEGNRIRITKGGTRTFGNGLYARYITPPSVIDGSTAPTLEPDEARILIVYKALIAWASGRGMRDPAPFERMFNQAWYGNPQTGETGWLTRLKTSNPFGGLAAFTSDDPGGLSNISQISRYSAL